MASTPDIVSCGGSANAAPDLSSSSPFTSLNYHFGMLLGVADLETEQAYHRGKMWLHNGWLHRDGVVYGFDVRLDVARSEIVVTPGLALDALGRELHLEADACVNLPAWFEAHREDEGFEFEETATEITFDAHVVIRFKACFTRQVPAMTEPCQNAGVGAAYSRVFETVEIFLRPGTLEPAPLPYHRLRLMFGLDEPALDEGAIVPADQDVLNSPSDLASFRRFAALDAIDLTPPPAGEEAVVLLANISAVTLTKAADNKLTLSSGTVDVAARRTLVATAAIQELLNGGPKLSGAPRVEASSFTIDEPTRTIRFRVTEDLAPTSVQPAAFSVTFFDAGGWQNDAIQTATYDNATRTVTVVYAAPVGGSVVRFLARGSGPAPILGANLEPLNFGADFVQMHKRI